MPQKDYDAFLKSLKQWVADNQKDYDDFEEMMANEPEQGYYSIIQRTVTYFPALKKMASKKLNSPEEVELSDVIAAAEESGLEAKLIATFDKKEYVPFIPALLCWLHLGRSFEGMVEFGEKIIEDPQTSKLEKLKTLMMLKLLIWHSKKLKIRTQEDWDNYYKLRKVIGDTSNLDWAMEKAATKKVGRKPAEVKPIIEFLSDSLTGRQKSRLLNSISDYIKVSEVDTARYVATMITALKEFQYVKPFVNKSFYDSIRAEFDVNIGSDTLINNYLNPNNSVKNLKKEEIEVARTLFDLKVAKR